jgi:hypothetical protein
MKLTEEWFRQFGRLDLSINDEGYQYELITPRCSFWGTGYATTKKIALHDLFIDLEYYIWTSCKHIASRKH